MEAVSIACIDCEITPSLFAHHLEQGVQNSDGHPELTKPLPWGAAFEIPLQDVAEQFTVAYLAECLANMGLESLQRLTKGRCW